MFKSGVGFYALFGFGWWMWGLGGVAAGVALPVGIVVALALMLTARRRLPDEAGDFASPEVRRRFGWINGAQWLLIGAAVVGCVVAGIPELLPALVALIVGAHFVPLAAVFGDPRLRVPGVLLIAAGFAGVLLRSLSHPSAGTMATTVGVPCALILWGTGLWVVATGANRAART
ncbi:hypothetical protein [Streptacidiphilus fuscans]|uniref:Uncharacterized protein n=1 Tax=Streptacidiphilus fuscans TaxID=2789292 RepID=A0A931BB45_9ACTN|nr:hypothetical protein [Streptacidiphilus fuscans]MBF9070170.1 hypothetical protein [Streptacidiphilus fuscans]